MCSARTGAISTLMSAHNERMLVILTAGVTPFAGVPVRQLRESWTKSREQPRSAIAPTCLRWACCPIAPQTQQPYFYVDPSASNEQDLLPSIRGGGCVILYGAYGSGKSTKVFQANEQLAGEFCCLRSNALLRGRP